MMRLFTFNVSLSRDKNLYSLMFKSKEEEEEEEEEGK